MPMIRTQLAWVISQLLTNEQLLDNWSKGRTSNGGKERGRDDTEKEEQRQLLEWKVQWEDEITREGKRFQGRKGRNRNNNNIRVNEKGRHEHAMQVD